MNVDEADSGQTWSRSLLDSLSHLTTTYAKTIIVVVLATSVLAAFYTARSLELVTGRGGLISPENRALQLDAEYADTFHGLAPLIVVVEGPNFAAATAFVRRLGDRLAADTAHVEEVFYQIDTSSLQGKKLLLLPPEDLSLLRDNVEEHQGLVRDLTLAPGVNTIFAAMNQKISAAMVSRLATGFLGLDEPENEKEEKPVDLSFLSSLLGQMESVLTSSEFSYRSPWADFFGNSELASEGFLTSQDKRFVFLLIEPRQQSENFTAYQDSIHAVRHHVAELKQEFPRVQAGVTGEKALENDEMLAAQADTSIATVVSLAGITVLYLLFFRSIRHSLLIVFTLTVGLIWTLGFLTLTVGHLSLISIFVAPLLIGLADGFCVYFVTRYAEERWLGKSCGSALHATVIHATPGIVAAACATAVACYALMLADFRGIQELGFIAGTGILLSLLAVLTFLPALLALTEGNKEWYRPSRRRSWLAAGFTRWGCVLRRFRRPVLILTTGMSLLCLCALPTISFDDNLLKLQARGTESVAWELRIIENSERSSWYVLAAASSLAEAVQKTARFEVLPAVESVESIASLVPERQEERLRLVRELAPLFAGLPSTLPLPDPIDVEVLKHTLEGIKFKLQEDEAWDPEKKPLTQEIAEVRGLLTSVFTRLETLPAEEAVATLNRLQKLLFHDFADQWALLQKNLDPPDPITLADIPPQLSMRFVSVDGEQFLLQIYPRENIWEGEVLAEFISQLRHVDPQVTGSPVTSYESIRAIKNGFMEGGLYATVAILLVTFLTLRQVRDTLLVLVPVALGMLWTVGLMWLCDLQLNLANVMAVPLIIGIGIENGIHLVRRARTDQRDGWTLVGGSTGQSIALFSLTSMVGFGSLMVARHYGMFSMGLLLALAIGSVLLASLTVLPLFLRTPMPKTAPATVTTLTERGSV